MLRRWYQQKNGAVVLAGTQGVWDQEERGLLDCLDDFKAGPSFLGNTEINPK